MIEPAEWLTIAQVVARRATRQAPHLADLTEGAVVEALAVAKPNSKHFAYIIGTNAAIDFLRHWTGRQRQRVSVSLDAMTDESGQPCADDVGVSGVSGDHADGVDAVVDLERRAARRLTPEQRDILHMRAAGYTHEEIGERYGVGSSAAALRFSRILQRLA